MSYDDYDQDAAEARFDYEMAQLERIAELESLVQDMYKELANADGVFLMGYIEQRMTALGLLDGDAE